LREKYGARSVLSEIPGGSDPLTKLQVYVPLPPEASSSFWSSPMGKGPKFGPLPMDTWPHIAVGSSSKHAAETMSASDLADANVMHCALLAKRDETIRMKARVLKLPPS
jgi:hypothetical protein